MGRCRGCRTWFLLSSFLLSSAEKKHLMRSIKIWASISNADVWDRRRNLFKSEYSRKTSSRAGMENLEDSTLLGSLEGGTGSAGGKW